MLTSVPPLAPQVTATALPLAVLVLSAWIGWGVWVAAAVRRRSAWPEEALLGVSLIIAVGGWLNLASMISPQLWIALTAAGALTCAVRYRARILRPANPLIFDALSRPPAQRLLWGLLLPLSVIGVTAAYALLASYHHPLDDPSYYLTMAQKMLQTGGLGTDPFSERRMTTALGGKTLLDTLTLSTVGSGQYMLIESGLGWLCAVAVMLLWCARSGVRPGPAALTHLMPLAIVSVNFNHSAWLLPVALILYLILRIEAVLEGACESGAVLEIGLVTAAVCALKSYLVPPVGAMLAGSVVWALCGGRPQAACRLAIAALCAAVLLAPWCVSMYISCRTLLFPILGKGYHCSAYGLPVVTNLPLDPDRWASMLSEWARVRVMSLSAAGVLLCACLRVRLPRPALILTVSAAMTTLGIALLADGRWLERYAYSYTVPVLLCVMAALVIAGGRLRIVAAVVLALTTAAVLHPSDYRYKGVVASFELMSQQKERMRPEVRRLPAIGAKYRDAQSSVPAGARILAVGEWTCLMDQRRNPIWIADLPGNAGPPPGLPLDRGPQALWDYLRANGVEYVLLDKEGAFGPYGYSILLSGTELNLWERYEIGLVDRYCRMVVESAQKNAHYRKGSMIVLSLRAAMGEA